MRYIRDNIIKCKKIFLVTVILGLAFCLIGCKEEKKQLTFGDNQLVLLTSTPKGQSETYQMYTMNIMIYANGTVEIYASDFARWFGYEEIPVSTIYLTDEEIQEIKDIIVAQDIYNLRENVGNKDGISGTDKYITVYSATDSHTTGGTSVSNRQFVRAYDGIYEYVREECFNYIGQIEKTQIDGYNAYQSRSVYIADDVDNHVFSGSDINNVYVDQDKVAEGQYYVVIELDSYSQEKLTQLSMNAEDNIVILTLYINDTMKSKITIDSFIGDGKLYIECGTIQDADKLCQELDDNMN